MKTKLALFLALCLPACAQFNFFTALSTWKGASAPYVGPFDSYTATQGLWDINVRLLSSYTGNLITVRRSSDNATNSFTYVSATGKLDTNAITAWSGSDSVYITTIYDQSGGGRNFSQSNTTLQPKLINAGTFYSINGEPCMIRASDDTVLYAPVTGTIDTWTLIVPATGTVTPSQLGPLAGAGAFGPVSTTRVRLLEYVNPSGLWQLDRYGNQIYIDDPGYPQAHTYSVSFQNTITNYSVNIDTITNAVNGGVSYSPWETLSWLNAITNVSAGARWKSGSMAFFTSIPSDQTTIMRYYTNRFATTYIP